MSAVTRESMNPLVQTPDLEVPQPVTPDAAQSQSQQLRSHVEAHGDQGVPSAAASTVGALSSQSIANLNAETVLPQLKKLLEDGFLNGVSGEECRAALDLLESLPPREYQKAINGLSYRELGDLCRKMPSDLRKQLAESAVRGGLTKEEPPKSAPGHRSPKPPDQPALISNSPSIPDALREVIHQENAARAKQYEQKLNQYVDAYCARVKSCRTPSELRSLGPLSTPPAILEPGIGGNDFTLKKFQGALSSSQVGIERATKAVSDQVSAFRHEQAAGSFGLDVEGKFTVTAGVHPTALADVGATGGVSYGTKVTLTDDGRVLTRHPEAKGQLGIFAGHNELEAKFDKRGHLESVGVELLGAGVEYERDGKMAFKGGPVETFVNVGEGSYGASLGDKESIGVGSYNLEAELKAGFTYKGIAREYYQDIGGAQSGFFGPMPEVDAKVPYASLSKEKREWYARQGFTKENWPS